MKSSSNKNIVILVLVIFSMTASAINTHAQAILNSNNKIPQLIRLKYNETRDTLPMKVKEVNHIKFARAEVVVSFDNDYADTTCHVNPIDAKLEELYFFENNRKIPSKEDIYAELKESNEDLAADGFFYGDYMSTGGKMSEQEKNIFKKVNDVVGKIMLLQNYNDGIDRWESGLTFWGERNIRKHMNFYFIVELIPE